MANKEVLMEEYVGLLATKFKNSNKFIVEIKSSQAALKKMELERAGATVQELRRAVTDAKKDAICFLLMELSEFLGDQQLVKSSKTTRMFMQWGIKQIISKLKDLGVEMTEKEMKELTIDACMERIEKLKKNKFELEAKLAVLKYYESVYSL